MADTRTPSPAMGNPPTLQTVAAPARMPAFSTTTLMQELWEKACSDMSADELTWFADGAARQIAAEARSLGAVMERVASLLDSYNTDFFSEDDNNSSLFLTLHHQLKTIEGLAEISIEAASRARQMAQEGGAA